MIRAVIFDMDGVIADSLGLHARVESLILERHDIHISPEEITMRFAGRRTSDMFRELLRNNASDSTIQTMLDEKWDMLAGLVETELRPVDGAVELVEELHSLDFWLAVASSSMLPFVSSALKKFRIFNKFKAIISGEDVKNGKPHPECFLLAAKKLSVDPQHCVVIEDSVPGMVAAKRACMKCVGLVPSLSKEYPVELLVTSLRSLTADDILSL